MKHKTADLAGDLLDAAVALALGLSVTVEKINDGRTVCLLGMWMEGCERCIGAESGADSTSWLYAPSESWGQGGPLIETHGISIIKDKDDGLWYAGPEYWIQGGFDGEYATGPTPLIAAMRAFCAAKLGDEVELP
jgi:hypothetical protein